MKKDSCSIQPYLGKLLYAKRVQMSLTQERMAERLHIATRAYRNIELGKSAGSVQTLIFILSQLPAEEMVHVVHELTDNLYTSNLV